MKTSIKIKKFWYSPVGTDGGLGNKFKAIQQTLREGTVQFNGSDADVTNYPNTSGDYIESDKKTGEKTVNFQLADLTPDVIADFTGGTVVTSADSDRYEAPENQNQSIELSVKFLTDKNVLFEFPRLSFDGYPIVNDDDLHYHQMNSVLLKPEKAGVPTYAYDVLKKASANDITVFELAEQTGDAVITTGANTVSIEVESGTDVTALEPVVGASLGASVSPESGVATDFTSPVTYTVEAADGTKAEWTVTVTVAV